VTRNIPNVKRVISHVIMKDDPRRVALPAKKQAGTPPAK
jgi:hypothetical protein